MWECYDIILRATQFCSILPQCRAFLLIVLVLWPRIKIDFEPKVTVRFGLDSFCLIKDLVV